MVFVNSRTIERSRLKCGQYWPLDEDAVEEYGDFIVINSGMTDYNDYVVTNLILQNTKARGSTYIQEICLNNTVESICF